MDFTLRPATVDDAEAMTIMHVQSWRESYGHLLPPEFFAKQEAALPERIERYRALQVAGLEINLHFSLLPEIFAEAPHGLSDAQIFQFWRVQAVRQGVDVDG